MDRGKFVMSLAWSVYSSRRKNGKVKGVRRGVVILASCKNNFITVKEIWCNIQVIIPIERTLDLSKSHTLESMSLQNIGDVEGSYAIGPSLPGKTKVKFITPCILA